MHGQKRAVSVPRKEGLREPPRRPEIDQSENDSATGRSRRNRV